MKNVKIITFFLFIIISFLSCNLNNKLPRENYKVEDDVEMDKAIETAKKTLDSFDYAFKNYNGVFMFGLKKRFVENENVEDIWLTNIKFENGNYFGILNEPYKIKNVKAGDRIQIGKKDICDWMFIKNSQVHGGYTIEIFLKNSTK